MNIESTEVKVAGSLPEIVLLSYVRASVRLCPVTKLGPRYRGSWYAVVVFDTVGGIDPGRIQIRTQPFFFQRLPGIAQIQERWEYLLRRTRVNPGSFPEFILKCIRDQFEVTLQLDSEMTALPGLTLSLGKLQLRSILPRCFSQSSYFYQRNYMDD